MNKVRVEKYLKAESKIEVRVLDDDGAYYKSVIHGVKDRLCLITAPYFGRDNLNLYKGDAVEVILIAQNEKVKFKAVVTGKVHKPFQGYVLQVEGEGERIQLREYVRIKVALDAEWAEWQDDSNSPEDLEQVSFSRGIMVDLSGGGAGLVCDSPLPPDTRIMLRFTINLKKTEHLMSVIAVVRRCQPLDEVKKFVIGVAFQSLANRDQDLIIEYVFQKLREQHFLEDGVNG